MPRSLSDTEIESFKERLCEAAMRLSVELGSAGLTMRALASELGISAMTPYRYYKSKEAVLADVKVRALARFAQHLEEAFAGTGGLAERTARVEEAYVRFALREPWPYRLIFEPAATGEGDFPELNQARTRFRRTMTSYVEALVAAGELEGDPILLAHVFWAALHGAVMLELSASLSRDCNFTQIRTTASRTLFQGFAPRRRPARV